MEALHTIKQFLLVTLIATAAFPKVRVHLKPSIYVLNKIIALKVTIIPFINFRDQFNYFLEVPSKMRLLTIFSFLSITVGVTIILSIIGESNGKRIIYCSEINC